MTASRWLCAIFALAIALSADAAHVSTTLDSWLPARFSKACGATVEVLPLPEDILGRYHYDSNSIVVAPYFSESTLAHEVGHAVWNLDLTDTERREWFALHRANPDLVAVFVYPNEPPHSFAEAFAEFITDPNLMRLTSSAVFEWFEKVSGKQ